MSEWINIKDKKPKEHVYVLTIFEDGEMAVGWGLCWHGAREGEFAGFCYPMDEIADDRKVTHWMSLPEAPK